MAGAVPAHVGQPCHVGGDRPAHHRDRRPQRASGDQSPDAGAAPTRQRVDACRPRSLSGRAHPGRAARRARRRRARAVSRRRRCADRRGRGVHDRRARTARGRTGAGHRAVRRHRRFDRNRGGDRGRAVAGAARPLGGHSGPRASALPRPAHSRHGRRHARDLRRPGARDPLRAGDPRREPGARPARAHRPSRRRGRAARLRHRWDRGPPRGAYLCGTHPRTRCSSPARSPIWSPDPISPSPPAAITRSRASPASGSCSSRRLDPGAAYVTP